MIVSLYSVKSNSNLPWSKYALGREHMFTRDRKEKKLAIRWPLLLVLPTFTLTMKQIELIGLLNSSFVSLRIFTAELPSTREMCLRSNCCNAARKPSACGLERSPYFQFYRSKSHYFYWICFLFYILSLTWTLNLKVLIFDICTSVLMIIPLSHSQYGADNQVQCSYHLSQLL